MNREDEISRLLDGFRKFKQRYYGKSESIYDELSTQGQSPKTLVIGCSDSRVDPAILTSASPGDLFVIRNVANLVPPYEEVGGYHGVSSAIEFAVVNLQVDHVIVLGHRQCGGIRSLMQSGKNEGLSFVREWMRIAQPAKERVMARKRDEDLEALCLECEKESILISLANLRTFPFVTAAISDRKMNLFGAFFDLERGELLLYDEAASKFAQIEV